MLTKEQVETYHRDGYLHIKQLFTPEETAELGSEMVRIIGEWGPRDHRMARPMARPLPRRRGTPDNKSRLHAQPAFLFLHMGTRDLQRTPDRCRTETLSAMPFSGIIPCFTPNRPRKGHPSRCTKTFPFIPTMD